MLEIVVAADPTSAPGREEKRKALELLDRQTGGGNLWERMSIAAAVRDLG